MNFVFIFTDTQCKYMVGAYGQPVFDTPNLDRLAADGIRFERAYTACPVCTPARGALFTGMYPQTNGAWANSMAPQRHIPMWGDIFRRHGYRCTLTGKWHLDGTDYDGTGIPDGGFEGDWWYDRANLMADLPDNIRTLYSMATTADDMRREGFTDEHVYGHRVVDRALDFLERVGDEPFVLTVSLDEPHDPWMVPPDWWEKFAPGDIPGRPNYRPSMEGKPALQQMHAREIDQAHGPLSWEELAAKRLKFFGCNSYIDREVGRVVDAVDRLHADDTVIIYTSDHGDQLGSHGLHDKGPMMYEETCNIPFIVRGPEGAGFARGAVSRSPVSHLDVLPTMLDFVGVDQPESLHGVSLRPVLADPEARPREHAFVSFNRFGADSTSRGGLFPIRCITDGRYKLAINLLDRDELYDLDADPYELTNLIDSRDHAAERDALHDRLLHEIRTTRDPFECDGFADRTWRPQPRKYLPVAGDAVPLRRGFDFTS